MGDSSKCENLMKPIHVHSKVKRKGKKNHNFILLQFLCNKIHKLFSLPVI